MARYDFSFGPDGAYFLSTPYKWMSLGLPQALKDKLFAEVQAQNHFVSMGPDGAYFYARYTPVLRNTWTFQQGGGANGEVTKWLNERHSSGDSKIQLSYGPNSTWIACTSKGAAYWSGSLPSYVSNQISGFHPVKATLGVDHAYVLVDGKGRFKWNLMGKYEALDQILRASTLAIECVALNPYGAGQYIIVFQNGTWRAQLPVSYLDKISACLNESVQADATTNAQVASIVCQGALEQQRITNNFLMSLW